MRVRGEQLIVSSKESRRLCVIMLKEIRISSTGRWQLKEGCALGQLPGQTTNISRSSSNSVIEADEADRICHLGIEDDVNLYSRVCTTRYADSSREKAEAPSSFFAEAAFTSYLEEAR